MGPGSRVAHARKKCSFLKRSKYVDIYILFIRVVVIRIEISCHWTVIHSKYLKNNGTISVG